MYMDIMRALLREGISPMSMNVIFLSERKITKAGFWQVKRRKCSVKLTKEVRHRKKGKNATCIWMKRKLSGRNQSGEHERHLSFWKENYQSWFLASEKKKMQRVCVGKERWCSGNGRENFERAWKGGLGGGWFKAEGKWSTESTLVRN